MTKTTCLLALALTFAVVGCDGAVESTDIESHTADLTPIPGCTFWVTLIDGSVECLGQYGAGGNVGQQGHGTYDNPVDTGIIVKGAWYGANCPGALSGRTARVASACNYQQTCDYVVDDHVLGDPAPGCFKEFQVSYRCSTARNAPTYSVLVPAEAGYGSIAHLTCSF